MASDDPPAPLVAVPAAAMLLDRVTPTPPTDVGDDVAALKTAIDAAVRRLRACPAVVLVTTADDDAVMCAERAGLGAYGYPDVATRIRPASSLADRIATTTGLPLVHQPELGAEPSVLALQLAAAGVTSPLVVVTLAPPGHTAGRLAPALAEVVVADGVGVCVQGDLAATLGAMSPGYHADGADRWVARMSAAVEAGDADAIAGLGPEAADRYLARGWAPLWALALLATATGGRIVSSTYRAPRGVGQIVVAT